MAITFNYLSLYKKWKLIHLFLILQSENIDQVVEELIVSSTFPRLIRTGDLQSLNALFLASERMVVCKFRPTNILTAVVTPLGSFNCFNMEFPKGNAGRNKNVLLLLEHM